VKSIPLTEIAGSSPEHRPQVLSGTEEDGQQSARKPSFIVGIGASAGGLDSLEKFFRKMPQQTGLAFVVIQHLSPDYKSMMAELLSKFTDMTIMQAQDALEVRPDTIYLIPPKVSLTLLSGCRLHLSNRSRHAHVLHLPIDIFFRSLAENMRGRAVGIVLSGTGSDGTLGSRAIKEAGGMLMVQDPASAPFDGMPNSVINTGVADYVLSPEKMPSLLLKYVKHPLSAHEDHHAPSNKDEDTLARILELLRQETGLDFSFYKPNTIIRRIERRMGVNQIERMEHYRRYLVDNPGEVRILHSELLIGVTRFFRDHHAFELIQQRVVPEIVRSRLGNAKTPIRIWVAGCSSGEEVYSLAILIDDYLQRHDLSLDTKIFATDIDHRALEIAATGRYPASIVSDVPIHLLSRYFFKSEDYYQVVDKIRKMVIFAQHNLLQDPPFRNLDLVACRNLLIYLRNDIQQRVLAMFGFGLKESGFMFLGSSETVGGLSNLFSVFDNKWRIYCYRGGASFADFRFFHGDDPDHRTSASVGYNHPRVRAGAEADTIMQRLQGHLLDFHMPPTVILDQDFNIVHIVGDVNELLRLPRGQISFNIFKLADKNLSGLISSALREAQKTHQAVRYKDVVLPWKDGQLSLTLVVEPFLDDKTNRRFLFLTFQGAERLLGADATRDLTMSAGQDTRIQDLERELQVSRENLQATIEELETANEELQATNEELMSANEELQSTNEELQSVNEELFTVNAEYQNKIEELTALNNDMDNLLSSTNIGTLFLDPALRIRKFTPAIKNQFPIMDSDIGRPIGHFAASFDYPDLNADLQRVLQSHTPRERDVRLESGKIYQVSIQPYRACGDVIEGLVMTFVDISRRVDIEEALRVSEKRFEIAVESSTQGVWEWSSGNPPEDRWSPRFYELLGYEPDAFPAGRAAFRDMLHPDDRNATINALEAHLKRREPFDIDFRLRTRSGGYRWYWARGMADWDNDGKPLRMTCSIVDVHDRKRVREALGSRDDG
jgi:two-component system CheB/CheR fusion protein